MKIWAIVILMGILGGGIWKISDLAADNARLEGNVSELTKANGAHERAIAALEADKAAKDKAIAERTLRILELNKSILKAKDEIRVVTAKVVTEQERECLLSPVPDAILDLVFNKGARGVGPGGEESLPSGPPVQ